MVLVPSAGKVKTGWRVVEVVLNASALSTVASNKKYTV